MIKECYNKLKVILLLIIITVLTSCDLNINNYDEKINEYNLSNNFGYDVVYYGRYYWTYTSYEYYFIDKNNNFTTCVTYEYGRKGRTGHGDLKKVKYYNIYNNINFPGSGFYERDISIKDACKNCEAYLLEARKDWLRKQH